MQRLSPQRHDLESLALKSASPRKYSILDSRTALFFDFGANIFFLEIASALCPWSLASSFPVLGLERVGPRKGCSWPRIFFVSLASCFVSSTPPLLRGAIISFGALYQFLILLKFCFNGDTSTRLLLFVLETFMSKNILPHSKNFLSLSRFF